MEDRAKVNEKGLWITTLLGVFVLLCMFAYTYFFYVPAPSAFVERIDSDGVVWVQLDHISDNTTICVFYGDNVSNKQMWILK
jgi:uncharacterized membrane protein